MGKFEGTFSQADPLVIIAEGDTVTIPDAHLLFAGDFARSGTDLVITGEGKSVVVADYFGDAGLPTLASPAGAVLLPDVVSALAGPQAPGQYAQAGDLQAQEGIGSIVTLTGAATAQRSDGTVVTLGVDSRVAQGDVVQTGPNSALGIVFDDGTVFNLNADARMVLNELVYEPGGGSNSILFSLVQGVFSFVAGQVAPTGEMRVDTPAATMGIRGTSGIVKLETDDGVVVFRVVPDPVTNNVGTIVLYRPGTDTILVVMDSSDSQWAIDTVTGQVIEQPPDAEDNDIIQQLHDTFIRFAGVPTDQDGTQLAGEPGGSGLQTQVAPPGSDAANIVSLVQGALGETETLDGAPPLDGGFAPESEDDATVLPVTPPPPPSPPPPSPPVVIDPGPVPPVVDNIAPIAADVVLGGPGGGPARVGYYDMEGGQGNPTQVDPILAGGHFPVNIMTLSAEELAAIDILIVQNPSNFSYGFEFTTQLPFIHQAVANGLVVIIHDRLVTDAATILPGGDGFQISRDFSDDANIELLDASHPIAEGPGGIVSDTSLDGGDSSSHGFAFAGSLPGSADLILSRTDADEIVTFSYSFGSGHVVYSTIPLDHYLEGSGASSTVTAGMLAYAGNLIHHAAENLASGPLGTANDVITIQTAHLLANDSDPDGDPLTVIAVSATSALGATVTLNPDGTITYNPLALDLAEGEIFTDSFDYTISDGRGGTDTATVTFTIAGAGAAVPNQPPVAADDTAVTDENTVVTINALSNDSDPDGDPLTVTHVNGSATNVGTQVALPSGALLTLNADGSFTYDPNGQFAFLGEGATGEDSFTYTISDGHGGTDTATATVEIAGVNDDPVATNDQFATTEDSAVTGNVLDNDFDPDDGDVLTVTHVNGSTANLGTQLALASGALLVLNANGSFAYDPNGQFDTLALGDTGADSFTYTVSDGHGGTDTATVSLEIAGVNNPPVILDDSATHGAVQEDTTLVASGQMFAQDVDAGDSQTWSIVGGIQAHADYLVTIDALTVTKNGMLLFEDTFSDGVPPPSAPNFAGGNPTEYFVGGDFAESNGRAILFGPNAMDPDSGIGTSDQFALHAATLSTNTDPLNTTLGLKIHDSFTAEGRFDLSIPQVPRESYGIRLTDIFPDRPSNDVVELMVRRSLSGDLVVQLHQVNPADDTFDILQSVVLDPQPGDNQIDLRLIHDAEDPGTVRASFALVQDGIAQGAFEFTSTGQIYSDETWTRAQIISYQPEQDKSVLFGNFGVLSLDQQGQWHYTLANYLPAVQALGEGETAEDTFVVQVTDTHGATAEQTITVTVNGYNDPPVAVDDSFATQENTEVSGNVLANNGDGPDFDVDGDPLTVTHVNGSTANVGTQIMLASGAMLALNADGSFAYDPNNQFGLATGESAEDSFTYTISDGLGGTDTATVTLTITGVDDAPVATASMVATNEDVAAAGMLAGRDLEGDTFSLETEPENGSVVIDADGSFTYTPDAGVTGADSFTFRVTDGQGAFDTATVTVDVAPVGEAEVSKNITGTDGNDVLIGSSLSDTLFGGPGNDILRSGGAPQTFFGLDRLDGGPGDDVLIAEGGAAILVGGPGNDVLTRVVTGQHYDFVRASYESSPEGIVANFTGNTIDGLAPGEVADGFGTVDQVSFMHVLLDSPHDDFIYVDDTYSNGESNWIEVRLSAGDDTVVFDNVAHARIGFGSAGGGVLADLETGTATDLDPGDNFIGTDTFSGKVHVLRGSHFDDVLLGSSGNDAFRGEGGDDYIDGRGGTNIIQFVSSPEGVHVDLSQNLVLNDGIWIEALERHGIDVVYNIHNVSGSDWDDLIIGDAGSNRLFGGLGNDILRSGGAPQNFFGEDWLFGGPGDDTLIAEGGWVVLDGGPGNDVLTSIDEGGPWDFVRADYQNSPAGIVANLSLGSLGDLDFGQVADGFGTVDQVSNVHVIADSPHDDVIHVDHNYTNSFGNWIEVRLSGGDDTVFFDGVSTGRISYAQALGPVLLDMEEFAAKDRPADFDPANYSFADANPETNFIGIDTFVGATEARGSRYGDVLYGRWEANDSLRGSGGDDYIDGRGGTNTISFGDSSSGIHVDLSQNLVLNDGIWIDSLGRHGIDEVHNIHNVSGSSWGDRIIGDDGNNVLRSGGTPQDFFSYDFLDGRGGDDVLTAQGGNVILVGGPGNDVLQSFDQGEHYDWVRADYQTSPSGIVANLTGATINGLAPREVADGFGTIDQLWRMHVIADSPHDDVIHVDGSYTNSFGNFLEVRLSGGNDTVNFNGVANARISYQQALGPVLLDMELAQAKDKPADFDPANDSFADAIPESNFIGNDTFAGVTFARGSNFDDVLLGRLESDDSFRGSGGDDYIDGRGGTNTITFGDSASGIHVDLSQNAVFDDGILIEALGRNGIDEVYNIQNVSGSDWDDVIIGDGGGNRLFGGLGDDVLRSGGAPQVFAHDSSAVDRLDGGPGDDTLIAEGGFVVLVGGPGNDILTSTDSGAYYDWVTADYRTSPAAIVANLTAVAVGDLAPGEVADGYGTVDHVSNVHVITGTNHDDVIHVDGSYTNSFGNWIEVRLGAGDDTVVFDGVETARISYSSAQGAVLLDMQAGGAKDKPADYDPAVDNFADANAETNFIGNDTFVGANVGRGSQYDDVILGREAGNDELRGSGGDDYIDGRGGTNTITFSDSPEGIHVDLSQDPENRVLNDGIWNFEQGRNGIDEVHNVQNVRGSDFDDLIIGDDGDNVLEGGLGNDTLVGGAGNDTLIGGPGADRFAYGSPHDGVDDIIDFTVSEDVLVIDASAFGGGLNAAEGLSENQFVSGNQPEATEAHGQFLYDSTLGDLWWDADGTGDIEAVQLANLAGAPGLTASDFELVESAASFMGMSEVAAAVDGGGDSVA